MGKSNLTKATMAKDTLLYIPAKFLEGAMGMVMVFLYTNFFGDAGYGVYSLVMTTSNFIYVAVLSWLLHVCFRHVNDYVKDKKEDVFYSTIFSVWIKIMALSALFTVFFSAISFFAGMEFFTYTVPSVMLFCSFATVTILYGIIAALRRIKLNLIMSVFAITAKVAITFTVIFLIPQTKETVLLALGVNFLVDTFVSIFIFTRLKLYRHISKDAFSKDLLKEMVRFGVPFIGIGITIPVLNISDRYIIRIFFDSSQVGIYTANYAVASAVFTILPMAVLRGVYPTILNIWKESREKANVLLTQALRYYIIIAMPAAVGLCALSRAISSNLGETGISNGYLIIIFVSIGMFLQGVSEFTNKSFELMKTTRPIFTNSLVVAVFNVVSNLATVPFFGYIAAAVNTLTSLILLLILSRVRGRKVLKWDIPVKSIIKIGISSLAMVVVILPLIHYLGNSFLSIGISIFVGAIVYGVVLYITGDVKDELFALINKYKSRKEN